MVHSSQQGNSSTSTGTLRDPSGNLNGGGKSARSGLKGPDTGTKRVITSTPEVHPKEIPERHISVVDSNITPSDTKEILSILKDLGVVDIGGLKLFARDKDLQKKALEAGLSAEYLEGIKREYGKSKLAHHKDSKGKNRVHKLSAGKQKSTFNQRSSIPPKSNNTTEAKSRKIERDSRSSSLSSENDSDYSFGSVSENEESEPEISPPVARNMTTEKVELKSDTTPKLASIKSAGNAKSSTSLGSRSAALSNETEDDVNPSLCMTVLSIPLRACDCLISTFDGLFLDLNNSKPKS